MFKFIVFMCFTSVAFGQISLEGKCDFRSQEPINVQGLAGEWKQLQRINETGSVDGNCLTLNFLYNLTTAASSITTTSVSNKKLVSRNATIVGKDLTKGILQITYTDGIKYDMVIQATDYTNFVILHGCMENNNTKSVFGHVYTRSLEVTAVINKVINDSLKANTDFANAVWMMTSHSTEACATDSGMSLQVSSYILLLVGLMLAKDI